ncbi:MAG: tetratricopeptide repeat protein [Verrucomicrobiaceae bacterium]|nr:tetratricopeptide repeat protein [Verrucomicrobiaceae bacterium]
MKRNRYQLALTLALLAGGCGLLGVSEAQEALFPQAPPPPKAQQSTGDVEIQKPLPFSDQERRVLESANKLPIERLQELLGVYERLNNTAMMDALIRAILKRDPNNAQAIKSRAMLDPTIETREIGYMEKLAAKVISGQRVEDVDSIEIHASNLVESEDYEEAKKLLAALRKNQFEGTFFPLLDDLALCYAETGDFDKAEAAYRTVAEDQRYAVEVRQEAVAALPGLEIQRRMYNIKHRSGGNIDRMVSDAAKLVRERPQDQEVIAFYIECLDRARRYDDAIDYLEKMKRGAGRGAWPWQPTLAFAYYGAKRFDEAVDAFREIKNNREYDQTSRLEAESMILEIGVSREVEKGLAAINRSDMATAEASLKRLEKNNPNHADTLGFKAIVLAKQGRSDEALSLLNRKKSEMESQGLAFTQADSMADVYVTRKEFSQARASVLAVLNDNRYDDEARTSARIQLANIDIAERLEEGYLALRDSRRAKAKAILDEVRAMSPQSPDVAAFAAEVDLAYNKPQEALAQLSELKAKATPEIPFTSQNSYANALGQLGQWEEASAAYSETLTQPGFTPQDLQEAMWMQRNLIPYFRPHLRTNARYSTEQLGTIFSTDTQYLTGWHANWRYGAFARSDYAAVEPGEGSVFGDLSGSRYEGGAIVQRKFNDGYYAEATLGASQEGVLYGFEFGRMGFQRLGWAVGWAGNARSVESVAMQALNGRENRAYATLNGPLTDRIVLNALAYYNWTNVGGDPVGDGIGIEVSADYIFQTETATRPELAVGYFGEYRRFNHASTVPTAAQREVRRAVVPGESDVGSLITGDPTRDVLNTLADPKTNRHGALFKMTKRINDRLNAYLNAGFYYQADDVRSLEFLGALGAEYWVNDSSMLFGEIRYDTSGSGASTGIGVLEASIGGMIAF